MQRGADRAQIVAMPCAPHPPVDPELMLLELRPATARISQSRVIGAQGKIELKPKPIPSQQALNFYEGNIMCLHRITPLGTRANLTGVRC